MASDGVRLVERLRLGERPLEADWALASTIIQLRDAASGFLDAANDVIEDRDKAGKRLRFLVRIELLSAAATRLEVVVDGLTESLNSYFELRAEDAAEDAVDDASDDGKSDQKGSAVPSTAAPVETIRNEITVVLEAGGIEESDAKAIGDTSETLRLDCAWLIESLAGFVASDADVDVSLDFCGDIEARFSPAMFDVGGRGRLAQALQSAMDRVLSDH